MLRCLSARFFAYKFQAHCVFYRCLTNNFRIPRAVPAPKKKSSESGYLLLVLPITAFGLGTWQVYRREWKLKLIKHLEEQTAAAPIPLPNDLEELKDLEYRRVIVRGKFDHSKEMVIAPRRNVQHEEMHVHMSVDPKFKMGSLIITPFILSDRNQTILVNRGWVPTKNTDPETRLEGQIEDEDIELVGTVRHTEKRAPLTPKDNPELYGVWMRRDIKVMAEYGDAEPVFIDADLNSSVPGGPIGGQTRVTLRNQHTSYLITWYALSVITFYMWYRRYRKPPPPMSTTEILKRMQ